MSAPVRNRATARSAALRVLTACRKNGAWADASLKAQLSRDHLSESDAALCTRMVYGVLQNRLLLEYYLSAYCRQALEHLQPPLREILQLGAYQILYLDKVPDSAAVNEAVNLAKETGRGAAAGLVNAVLRQLSIHKEELPALPDKDAIRALSICYSHPRWLVKRLIALLGEAETEALLRLNNAVAPLTVQVNPLKTTREALSAELEASGIGVKPHDWVPGCLELDHTGDLQALPAFQEGKFLVQDGAAALVAAISGVKPGDRVLDICAAPGGKSFGAAMAMGNRGSILSCDLHENKLSRIREGADRLGISIIATAAADGRRENPDWRELFDVVMADVPCSGLGIIRKKPDTRYKSADELFALPVIQSAILTNAARYVRPGGTLVYSTCTILPEENEQVTDSFLAEHPDFVRTPFVLPGRGSREDGQVTLWPQRHGTDGFYICRMMRRET